LPIDAIVTGVGWRRILPYVGEISAAIGDARRGLSKSSQQQPAV